MRGSTNIPEINTVEQFGEYLDVSRETLDRLGQYEALLCKWQQTINLVAPSTLGAIWNRHFADSAQLLRLAPGRADSWIDLGSGAGFPGLVVAILRADPRLQSLVGSVTLVESDSRKAAFLREVARNTGVAVDILCTRIEKMPIQGTVNRFDVICGRALAPLSRLLGLAAPFFGPKSVGLFPKGQDFEAEVASAQKHWQFAYQLERSVTDERGRIVVIEHFEGKTRG